jgi:nucleoside-diphosphate-sugar epimerase
VDLRDVVDAAILGLTAEGISHDAFLLAADDTMVDVPTAELVETYYPDTPWPKAAREEYLSGQPYRALVDCSHAKRKLGWRPRRSWREFARQNDEASKR